MRSDPIPELKKQLGAELARLIRDRRGADMAVLLATDLGRVSNLRHEKLERFSLETLIRFLARVGRDIELQVVIRKPRPRPQMR